MITRAYRYITWLSLDVTAGAIVFMYFLSQEFDTSVHWNETIALGIAIWLIYTTDHLLDVRGNGKIHSARRKFHKRNFKALFFACVAIAGIGLTILATLPKELLVFGFILAATAGAYLFIAQLKKWSKFKEIQIALGYALGVSLIPLVRLEIVSANHWLVVGLLFFLALFNLVLFSLYERATDKSEGFRSLALSFSKEKLSLIFWIIVGLSVAGSCVLLLMNQSIALSFFFLLGTSINFMLWRFPVFFQRDELYRIVGDAVFLIPIISLF